MRRYLVIMGIVLGLLLAPVAEARRCYYCDVANVENCPGVQITCAEKDDCYTGRGAVLGLPMVITKGCVESSQCGLERQFTYMNTNYTVLNYCCRSELCNRVIRIKNRTLSDVASATTNVRSAKTGLMLLLVLFLLWAW
ncbi:sperm acrosome membrane-associated protein 4-like [Sarcophilus harrisii]|uniref:sperm acrosome membrane-associated protein 4-like n=1 Tax=Sarcophilus harrisii TaxID=9305 RepID=UPI000C7D83FF|nr:sperm acrosome membrane-associated protein 4-like [Sarcophilus harrisii]